MSIGAVSATPLYPAFGGVPSGGAPEARAADGASPEARQGTDDEKKPGTREDTGGPEQSSGKTGDRNKLSSKEQRELRKLEERDREVRAHEQAHKAAGGEYVRGGVSYEYKRGPDGRQYAVGGEVSIDTSKEADPEATIRKAEAVKAAAMAPANPSAKDHQVASAASRMAAQARRELAEQRAGEESGSARQAIQAGESRDDPAKRFEARYPAESSRLDAYA